MRAQSLKSILTKTVRALLASETIPYILNGKLEYAYDNLGRRTGLQLQQNTTPLVSHQYTYDTMSRLATVGDGTHTAAYSRIPGGNLLLPLICNVLNFS